MIVTKQQKKIKMVLENMKDKLNKEGKNEEQRREKKE